MYQAAAQRCGALRRGHRKRESGYPLCRANGATLYADLSSFVQPLALWLLFRASGRRLRLCPRRSFDGAARRGAASSPRKPRSRRIGLQQPTGEDFSSVRPFVRPSGRSNRSNRPGATGQISATCSDSCWPMQVRALVIWTKRYLEPGRVSPARPSAFLVLPAACRVDRPPVRRGEVS